MNKQIEEMAKDLGGTWIVDFEGNPHDLSEVLMQCDIESIAEQLCQMNYRKASEVAREIFEEIEKHILENCCVTDDDVDGIWKYIAELKKKYAEVEG